MRVLVTIRNSPAQVYMVRLLTRTLVDEVRELINRRKHSQAVVAVMTKGSFERRSRRARDAGSQSRLDFVEQ